MVSRAMPWLWFLPHSGAVGLLFSRFSALVPSLDLENDFLHTLDTPWLSDVKFDMTKLALTLSMDVVGSLSGIVVPCFESVLLLAFRLGQGALGVLLAAMIGSFVFSHVFGDLCPLLWGMVFALSAVMYVSFLYFDFLFGYSRVLKGLHAFRMPLLGVVVGFFFDFFVLTKGRFVFWAPLISSFFIGMLPVVMSVHRLPSWLKHEVEVAGKGNKGKKFSGEPVRQSSFPSGCSVSPKVCSDAHVSLFGGPFLRWVLDECRGAHVAAFCVLIAICESTCPAAAMTCAHDVLGIYDVEDFGYCAAARWAAAAVALLYLVQACGGAAAAMCRAVEELPHCSLSDAFHKLGICSLEGWCNFSEFLDSIESECHEVFLKGLVTTTLSPSKGPRVAFQAKATPRVDVAEVPSVPSSQQALCVKSCFDQFPGSFGDDTPGSLVTPSSGLSFMLVTLSGKTLTMNEDPGILVSELLDKIAGLSALPTSAFYLTFGHTCLNGTDTLKSAGVQRDSLLRMRGRLLGGTARGPRNFQVPGSWHCSFCNMGGCWPGRDRCFRCNNPRFSNARRPPRESHFPGRPVQHGVSREPTIRASRPQPAPKSGPRPSPAAASQSSSASPPGHAQAVLKALKGLGLPDALLQQVHQSLSPPQKPFTSRHRQLAIWMSSLRL